MHPQRQLLCIILQQNCSATTDICSRKEILLHNIQSPPPMAAASAIELSYAFELRQIRCEILDFFPRERRV